MSKISLKIVKTKLLNYKDIYKYIFIYQESYNQIYDLIIKNSNFFTKRVIIFLQLIIILNIGNKYIRIMITCKMK